MKQRRIIIITGSPGTGKTTTSNIVAEKSDMEKSVHMHTDDFYHYLVKGAIPPHLPESNEQNRIVIEAFLEAAKRYVCGGYDVIVDGIIGPWFLAPWLNVVKEGYEVHYMILRAGKEETMKRAVSRSKLNTETNIELVKVMWEQFSNLGVYEANVIDTTNDTIYDTVSKIREKVFQWHKAKDLVRDYNHADSAETEKKERILNDLLGGKEKNLWITAPFFVDYGNNIYFGNNCEVNMNCTFLDDNVIRIGDNALIAPNVQIYTAFHPTNAADRFGEPKEDGSFEFCKTQTAPVTIGNNVWIGGGAIIMPGVTIGDNVVIGAGSIVTKDIPSDTIAYGNPCRVMRENRS